MHLFNVDEHETRIKLAHVLVAELDQPAVVLVKQLLE